MRMNFIAVLFLILPFLSIHNAFAEGGRMFGIWQLHKGDLPLCSSPSGTLIYGTDGFMSMGINCKEGKSLFYMGSFKVQGHEVVHHVVNASDPSLLGKDLVKTVESLKENELVLTELLGDGKGSLKISWVKNPQAARPEHLAVLSYHKVKPGAEERFRKEISKIIEASRSEPGNIAWFVQEEKEDPTRFVFYTRWVDDGALKFHLESPPLATYLKQTAPLLAEPAKLVKFNPVDE